MDKDKVKQLMNDIDIKAIKLSEALERIEAAKEELEKRNIFPKMSTVYKMRQEAINRIVEKMKQNATASILSEK